HARAVVEHVRPARVREAHLVADVARALGQHEQPVGAQVVVVDRPAARTAPRAERLEGPPPDEVRGELAVEPRAAERMAPKTSGTLGWAGSSAMSGTWPGRRDEACTRSARRWSGSVIGSNTTSSPSLAPASRCTRNAPVAERTGFGNEAVFSTSSDARTDSK